MRHDIKAGSIAGVMKAGVMKTGLLVVAVAGVVLGSASSASADVIHIIRQNSTNLQNTNAFNYLTALGHTVTTSDDTVPGALSGFDQVWDLRFESAITGAQASQFETYLQGGGRMYLTGEAAGLIPRNNSIGGFLAGVGAGGVTLTGATTVTPQTLTSAGQLVNSPNAFASVNFGGAEVASSAGTGFFVTETSLNSGRGSLIGWDFGDIAGASSARMLVGYDIEIFTPANGQNWAENMATFLGADNPIIPLPTGAAMAMVGLGLVGVRRRRN